MSLSPLDFIARLVALIPTPRINMVRYKGIFAPNFGGRKLIVKKPKDKPKPSDPCSNGLPEKVKQERLRWAEMLKRVFDVDVTICPKCQG